MNSVDLALALVLALCAMRGYARGIFRESLGLIALAAGALAAVVLTPLSTVLVRGYLHLPRAFETGTIFVATFVVVYALVNLSGVAIGLFLREARFRRMSRMAGAAVSVVKGVAVLAFVLLFFHLFPASARFDEAITNSTVGRVLVDAAGDIVRLGLQLA